MVWRKHSVEPGGLPVWIRAESFFPFRKILRLNGCRNLLQWAFFSPVVSSANKSRDVTSAAALVVTTRVTWRPQRSGFKGPQEASFTNTDYQRLRLGYISKVLHLYLHQRTNHPKKINAESYKSYINCRIIHIIHIFNVGAVMDDYSSLFKFTTMLMIACYMYV